ncbi:MAG TPA: hypothetical protein VFR29_00815 [Steroidobacteraceae bacterium]|nr:hypothetical protein [Steroidobacteraceae bacterium]
MRRALPSLALLLACTLAAGADESRTRGFFAALAGDWQGQGETLGMASVQQARWEPALGAAFFRFVFDNRMTAADGTESRFRAEAFYRVGRDGAVTGTWLDSRGVTQQVAGGLDQSGALVILWGSEATERGRSTYRLVEDALEITDEVVGEDGNWRVFGQTRLARNPR